MVRIRRREDGPKKYYNHHRGIRVSEDNSEADVDEADAEYLVEEHGGFEYVDGRVAVEDVEGETESDDESAPEESESDEGKQDEPDGTADDAASDEPETVSAVEGSEQEVPPEEPPIDPAELTVSELEGELEANDYSEAELLAIYSAEREAKDRTTAVEAIDEALEDVEG